MATFPRVSVNVDLSEGLCFGCGKNNPIGLKLKFRRDGKGVRTEFTPGSQYQGWPGMVHGGILICMLDEAMTYAARFAGAMCITARMDVKLKHLVPVEEPLIITSSVTRHTRRLLNTRAEVCLRDGTVVAEGTSTQFVVEDKSGEKSNVEGTQADAGKQA